MNAIGPKEVPASPNSLIHQRLLLNHLLGKSSSQRYFAWKTLSVPMRELGSLLQKQPLPPLLCNIVTWKVTTFLFVQAQLR